MKKFIVIAILLVYLLIPQTNLKTLNNCIVLGWAIKYIFDMVFGQNKFFLKLFFLNPDLKNVLLPSSNPPFLRQIFTSYRE